MRLAKLNLKYEYEMPVHMLILMGKEGAMHYVRHTKEKELEKEEEEPVIMKATTKDLDRRNLLFTINEAG